MELTFNAFCWSLHCSACCFWCRRNFCCSWKNSLSSCRIVAIRNWTEEGLEWTKFDLHVTQNTSWPLRLRFSGTKSAKTSKSNLASFLKIPLLASFSISMWSSLPSNCDQGYASDDGFPDFFEKIRVKYFFEKYDKNNNSVYVSILIHYQVALIKSIQVLWTKFWTFDFHFKELS